MPINWKQVEQEEDDLCERLNQGEITQQEYDQEMREIRNSVAAAYEDDRQAALEQVDYEWGYR